MFYICNCIIVILYIPRHVVRVNKSYLILSYLGVEQEAVASMFVLFRKIIVLVSSLGKCTFPPV